MVDKEIQVTECPWKEGSGCLFTVRAVFQYYNFNEQFFLDNFKERLTISFHCKKDFMLHVMRLLNLGIGLVDIIF
jgi:hypothetical protein